MMEDNPIQMVVVLILLAVVIALCVRKVSDDVKRGEYRPLQVKLAENRTKTPETSSPDSNVLGWLGGIFFVIIYLLVGATLLMAAWKFIRWAWS